MDGERIFENSGNKKRTGTHPISTFGLKYWHGRAAVHFQPIADCAVTLSATVFICNKQLSPVIVKSERLLFPHNFSTQLSTGYQDYFDHFDGGRISGNRALIFTLLLIWYRSGRGKVGRNKKRTGTHPVSTFGLKYWHGRAAELFQPIADCAVTLSATVFTYNKQLSPAIVKSKKPLFSHNFSTELSTFLICPV
ncbi:MAG: hypothetical protein GVY02_06340 [Bacteroidetes bacterium]|jgi:hypothetical protein|nr:hypothetical protein [Bacteroidota bacterium]